jgi:3-deoxy-manno-octulosonate cytidylyltransferase (CMP-KDO synthetase)
MASSRFPGKPLAPILGLSMVEHVYRRALASEALDRVLIATCDEEIRAAAEAFGAPVAMTSDRHERAAERIAEAAREMTDEIVVLVQGDEPMLRPESLDALVAPLLAEPDLPCTNLMLPIDDEADARDPDQVKVVLDAHGNAIYMSREAIPTSRYGLAGRRWRQIGLIAFRRRFLLDLMALAPTPLERAESVDMMRAIEHGFRVRMVPTADLTYAVDSPPDIPRVEALMRTDPLYAAYARGGTDRRKA